MSAELDCAELERRLFEFLDQELPEQVCAAARAHLAHCPPCEGRLAHEEHFLARIRQWCTSDTAPDGVRERLLIRLRRLDSHRG